VADRQPVPSRNPFVLPTGPAGRFAGWIMGRDDRPHREAAELLAPGSGAAVCEIGFGPGQLLTVLADRDPDVKLSGADPSPVMLTQARRRLETAHPQAARTADLRLGVAEALPFADDSADHVAAINNAAIWPDLRAGLVQAHRVLRPGGTLLLAWHSPTAPSRLRRTLARPDSWWRELLDAVRDEFGNVQRHELRHLTACIATT
jgi:ubiquinone/menaquinone biosynthesis C-methylase UbiE